MPDARRFLITVETYHPRHYRKQYIERACYFSTAIRRAIKKFRCLPQLHKKKVKRIVAEIELLG